MHRYDNSLRIYSHLSSRLKTEKSHGFQLSQDSWSLWWCHSVTFSVLFSKKPTDHLTCCMRADFDKTAVQPACSSNLHSESRPYQKETG